MNNVECIKYNWLRHGVLPPQRSQIILLTTTQTTEDNIFGR